jgi:hypothetical protein
VTIKHKSIRHKSIKLLPHERALLLKMYLEGRIAIEQYEARSIERERLAEEWNKLTGRSDAGSDLVHYMRTQRKRGLWVKLEGAALPSPPTPKFSAEETEVLVNIYTEEVAAMGVGSDVLAYEDELKTLIAKEFAGKTGRIIAADDLVAKLTALRKRGMLPKAADVPIAGKDADVGFGDIDNISKAE